LNVHEGPHRISPRVDEQGLFPGMVISNEPGYYQPNAFGVRIENLLVVVEKPLLGQFGGKAFAGFERLTQIPIQHALINHSLLDAVEIDWINTYHSEIEEVVMPLLVTDRARKWLKNAVLPVDYHQRTV
jgi:Xaa-Pro aminopeptidase